MNVPLTVKYEKDLHRDVEKMSEEERHVHLAPNWSISEEEKDREEYRDNCSRWTREPGDESEPSFLIP